MDTQPGAPVDPMFRTYDLCATACKNLAFCNAWVHCSKPEGCGSGCKSYAEHNPKRECPVQLPDTWLSYTAQLGPCCLVPQACRPCQVRAHNQTAGQLQASMLRVCSCHADPWAMYDLAVPSLLLTCACVRVLAVARNPDNPSQPNPEWSFPYTSAGPFGPTADCVAAPGAAEADAWPFGTCTLKVLPDPAHPTYWSTDASKCGGGGGGAAPFCGTVTWCIMVAQMHVHAAAGIWDVWCMAGQHTVTRGGSCQPPTSTVGQE
jgi:hypothetical protein